MLLKDKVCVIVGAVSLRSIGYATAELFAEHGAKVVVVDVLMSENVLDEIKSSIEEKVKSPVSVHGLSCDISKAEDCKQLIQEVLTLHGTVDCLVNSAGIVRSKPILELSEKSLIKCLISTSKVLFSYVKAYLKSLWKSAQELSSMSHP